MGLIGNFFKAIFIGIKKIVGGVVRKVKNVMTRFYEKALSMMKTVVNKIAPKVIGVILGSSHFFRKVGEIYQEGTKNYSLDEELGEWHETLVTKQIAIEEIPPRYRNLDEEYEIDDTKELDAVISY